mgnify:CR=1 FL=1
MEYKINLQKITKITHVWEIDGKGNHSHLMTCWGSDDIGKLKFEFSDTNLSFIWESWGENNDSGQGYFYNEETKKSVSSTLYIDIPEETYQNVITLEKNNGNLLEVINHDYSNERYNDCNVPEEFRIILEDFDSNNSTQFDEV